MCVVSEDVDVASSAVEVGCRNDDDEVVSVVVTELKWLAASASNKADSAVDKGEPPLKSVESLCCYVPVVAALTSVWC